MKLSIIIASYNEKKYIKDAIESCINQKHNYDYELIIGDDGSDDGSLEIINEYEKNYPQIIKSFVMDRTDVGEIIASIRVSNLLKRAFEISNGEYIMVMSADDLLVDPLKIEKQVCFLDSHLKYVSCYTDFQNFWDDGKTEKIHMKKNLSRSLLWSFPYIHISCFLFRKEIISNLLCRFCDDTGLTFSIIKTGHIKHLDCITFGYRQRDESIMHKADKMELCLLELSLYQDVLNSGKFSISSLSRYAKVIEYILINREKLKEVKYHKYIRSCSQYKNDILGMIVNYEKLSFFKKLKIKNKILFGKIFREIFSLIIVLRK